MQNRLAAAVTPLIVIGAVLLSGCGNAQDDYTIGSANGNTNTSGGGAAVGLSTESSTSGTGTNPSPAAPPPASSSSGSAASGLKVWTVAQILSEPRSDGGGGEPRCGGEGGFKRCLCPEDVPGDVRYRPAVKECNGHAAMIFSGRYTGIFSAVVRDSQNRDRWPAAGSGFGGCSAALADSAEPPSRCSAFKVQEKFSVAGGTAVVHCLGASGYSSLFSDVTRITVKLANDNTSSNDPLERFCIRDPALPLN